MTPTGQPGYVGLLVFYSQCAAVVPREYARKQAHGECRLCPANLYSITMSFVQALDAVFAVLKFAVRLRAAGPDNAVHHAVRQAATSGCMHQTPLPAVCHVHVVLRWSAAMQSHLRTCTIMRRVCMNRLERMEHFYSVHHIIEVLINIVCQLTILLIN